MEQDYFKKLAIGGAVEGILALGCGLSLVYDIENSKKSLHVFKGYTVAFGLDLISKFKTTNKIISYAQPLAFELLQSNDHLNDCYFDGDLSADDTIYDWIGTTIYYSLDNVHKYLEDD